LMSCLCEAQKFSVMVFSSSNYVKNLSKLSSRQSAYFDPEDIAFRNNPPLEDLGPILELAIEFADPEGEAAHSNMSGLACSRGKDTKVDDNDLLVRTTTLKYANKRLHRGRSQNLAFKHHPQGEMSHPAVIDTTALPLIKHNWKPWAQGACSRISQRCRSRIESAQESVGSSGKSRVDQTSFAGFPSRTMMEAAIAVKMHRVVSSREHSQGPSREKLCESGH
ncbi:hypothetical protein KCU60_g4, partial [Aureobasidium melanogenum]